MKYKCIKDCWMENESSETGHKPAFAKGETYEFYLYCDRDGEHLIADTDHHKRQHYMDKEELDNSGYFELVEDQQTSYKQDIVIKWLEKLHYVLSNDPNVEEQVFNYPTGLALETTLSSIHGATNIYEFVNMRYEHMQNEKSAKRKKELLDRQAELELELAKVKQELETK